MVVARVSEPRLRGGDVCVCCVVCGVCWCVCVRARLRVCACACACERARATRRDTHTRERESEGGTWRSGMAVVERNGGTSPPARTVKPFPVMRKTDPPRHRRPNERRRPSTRTRKKRRTSRTRPRRWWVVVGAGGERAVFATRRAGGCDATRVVPCRSPSSPLASCARAKADVPFHSIPFHSIPFRSVPFHSILFRSITFHRTRLLVVELDRARGLALVECLGRRAARHAARRD